MLYKADYNVASARAGKKKNELLRNVAIMTKSSTGTLFVFLALLVCYLTKNVFLCLVCCPWTNNAGFTK